MCHLCTLSRPLQGALATLVHMGDAAACSGTVCVVLLAYHQPFATDRFRCAAGALRQLLATHGMWARSWLPRRREASKWAPLHAALCLVSNSTGAACV